MSDRQRQAEQTFRRHLSKLTAWVGWYALVCDDRFGGIFPTLDAARHAAEVMYPSRPVLIRQIVADPPWVDGEGLTYHA